MRKPGEILRPRIKMGDSIDDCWLWLGRVNQKTGYGNKQFLGRTVLAHRWVYEIFNGWLPNEAVLDHLCRVRNCVNPRHLVATNHANNSRRGKLTKLSEAQAKEIKQAVAAVDWGGIRSLAEKYGVSRSLISDIKYGRAWRDI